MAHNSLLFDLIFSVRMFIFCTSESKDTTQLKISTLIKRYHDSALEFKS